jgi:hypothetical protein
LRNRPKWAAVSGLQQHGNCESSRFDGEARVSGDAVGEGDAAEGAGDAATLEGPGASQAGAVDWSAEVAPPAAYTGADGVLRATGTLALTL